MGTEPEEIIVAEKIALIHSEISEAYEAFLKNNYTDRHGVHEEMADVLLRTLHLGGIFKVPMDGPEPDIAMPQSMEERIATLHLITSEAYECYRHKKMEEFKNLLAVLAWSAVGLAVLHSFDLEAEVAKKMEINRHRTWDKGSMNETIG